MQEIIVIYFKVTVVLLYRVRIQQIPTLGCGVKTALGRTYFFFTSHKYWVMMVSLERSEFLGLATIFYEEQQKTLLSALLNSLCISCISR